MRPLPMIAIGFVLVAAGFLIPFLTVIGLVDESFLLLFLGYGGSIVGVVLGIVGIVLYMQRPRY